MEHSPNLGSVKLRVDPLVRLTTSSNTPSTPSPGMSGNYNRRRSSGPMSTVLNMQQSRLSPSMFGDSDEDDNGHSYEEDASLNKHDYNRYVEQNPDHAIPNNKQQTTKRKSNKQKKTTTNSKKQITNNKQQTTTNNKQQKVVIYDVESIHRPCIKHIHTCIHTYIHTYIHA